MGHPALLDIQMFFMQEKLFKETKMLRFQSNYLYYKRIPDIDLGSVSS
jgi:hypothetical protein